MEVTGPLLNFRPVKRARESEAAKMLEPAEAHNIAWSYTKSSTGVDPKRPPSLRVPSEYEELSISSADAQQPSKNSAFEVQYHLNQPSIDKFAIQSVIIPFTFLPVRDGKDVFSMKVYIAPISDPFAVTTASTIFNKRIQLEHGVWTPADIATELTTFVQNNQEGTPRAWFQGFKIIVDSHQDKFVITWDDNEGTADITQIGPGNCIVAQIYPGAVGFAEDLFGFGSVNGQVQTEKIATYSSSSATDFPGYTFPDVYNMNVDRAVQIRSRALSSLNKAIIRNSLQSTVCLTLPITTNYGYQIGYQRTNDHMFTAHGTFLPPTLDFELTDMDGKVLDLNGQDWQLTVGFMTYQDGAVGDNYDISK